MSCLVKMRAVRDELSANEKKIAEFILANSALIRDYSSQHLAGSVGVSQSSIVKFSQKLGYRGFTDLKLAIHEAVVKSESENDEINKRKHRTSGSGYTLRQFNQYEREKPAGTCRFMVWLSRVFIPKHGVVRSEKWEVVDAKKNSVLRFRSRDGLGRRSSVSRR